jgi:hypothetical protein
MRKQLPTLAALCLPTLLIAQQPIVTLTDEGGNVVNGTVVHALSGTWELRDTVSLFAQLNAESERTVNLRRYEVQMVEQSKNFYCWGVCYTAQTAGNIPVWESAHPVFMGAGQTVDNFHAYYESRGYAGASTFRFVWFDVDNMNDSTWVDIVFDSAVGMGENSGGVLGFDAYPNPALDAPMTVRFSLDPSVVGAQLVVYNALGGKVLVRQVRGASASVVLPRDEFQPGVYFANVEVGGRALITKRLIIGGR